MVKKRKTKTKPWALAKEGKTKELTKILIVAEAIPVAIEGKEILQGLNLVVKPGEVHAIMGPNGSGKSTLAYAIAGHPRYELQMLNAKFF